MYEVRYRDFGVDGQLPRNQAYDPLEVAYGEAKRLVGPRTKRSE